MPGSAKKMLPAPIDRPLSRAYLRQFTGWSTAFPPAMSDPSSLRIMENLMVNRDGSIRVRPGLRYLSYSTPPIDDGETLTTGVGIANPVVGTHEAFYLNDGTKAYLFAVREDNGLVGFRVLSLEQEGAVIRELDEPATDFLVPQTLEGISFSAHTTYVKYLQIDNKIFALSNAGETLRIFTVGTEKTAKRLSSIERPVWGVADKLTVVKPDEPWINSGIPTAVRTNLVLNGGLETTDTIGTADFTAIDNSTTQVLSGTKSLRVTSKPARINYVKTPLGNVAVDGVPRWYPYANADTVTAVGASLRCAADFGDSEGSKFYCGHWFDAPSPAVPLRVSFDLTGYSGIASMGVLIRCYDKNGAQVGADITRSLGAPAIGRLATSSFTQPAGTLTMRVFPYGVRGQSLNARFEIKCVLVSPATMGTTFFDGASGTNYFWEGSANNSMSVYHPPQNLQVMIPGNGITPGVEYSSRVQIRSSGTGRAAYARLSFLDNADIDIGHTDSAATADSSGAWLAKTATMVAVPDAISSLITVVITGVPHGEYHYLDEPLIEAAAAPGTYFYGGTASTTTIKRAWTGTVNKSPSRETTYSIATTIPPPETPTANTLISSSAAANVYSVGFFYTFENEVGESAASQVTVVKVQRRWSAWKWFTATSVGDPSTTETADPTTAADQLVAYMPQTVYDAAKAQGATKWNLYVMTWSDQDNVPVDGLLLESKEITAEGAYGTEGWIRMTPAQNDMGYTASVPSLTSRYNYSAPSSAGQGIVAADRMILVDDPNAQAVIRWSSNVQGEYTNFTASKGGGYKTLTSGNLYVPVSVKLWQNPQSADTLTILCAGVDGANTAYYMAPASVAQQSEQVTVMGFEETTASPGTVSPYGCEVLNNALYHPLDEMLMKSTASNYNISHKSMTDSIENRWNQLANKHRIVSSQHDNRLYYIVDNPLGADVEPGCMGNEIWVFDIASEKGTWSRWLIQASSLRRIENGGKVYMSVVRPDGIYFLDPDYDRDDLVTPTTRILSTRFIPWKLETNTQGANRSHDAWARVQQLTANFGNFIGSVKWGLRSWNQHGKPVDVSKVYTSLLPATEDKLPFDAFDDLIVGHDLMEWFFYAESLEEDGVPVQGYGQIDTVQYRYAPISVNIGTQFGSTETFEYGRAVAYAGTQVTDNGIPQPMLEVRRP